MPKNIVLLSDGTGNSSAKLAKTNVWRTYQALDLSQGDQIAWYDDGVGTSSVTILAIMGGAFGWGLKRNVLTLYKFLCRNYQAGDSVYAFGFSRGAFTIRVLIGLVTTEGLINASSEEELAVLAVEAYRAYRKKRFQRKASLSGIGRVLRRPFVAVHNKILGFAPYDVGKNVPSPTFRFVGLWDTVDAYGVPIKELKEGIDRYIWPMSFQDLVPSPLIQEACHALSLDDERETFHPLVWQASPDRALPDTIRQVWFSGVHSNVGGGYPDDGMAHVPLMWILRHAAAAGLKFEVAGLDEYQRAATPFGRMYDSRAGLASYYRYAPRNVAKADYPQPAFIHESVFYRMASGDDGYAPLSMGPGIRIVLAQGPPGPPSSRDLHPAPASTETEPSHAVSEHTVKFDEFQRQCSNRVRSVSEARKLSSIGDHGHRVAEATDQLKLPDPQAFDLVLDTVYWRRIAYWVLLGLTLLLASLRWESVPLPGDEHVGDLVTTLINLARNLVPTIAIPWLDGFCRSSLAFLILLVAAVSSYLWSGFLEWRISDRARVAWNAPGRGNRADYLQQSRQRWHFNTKGLIAIALLWLAWVGIDHQNGRSLASAVALVAFTVLLFGIRRRFDAHRAKKLAQPGATPCESPGWGLRVSHFLRTNGLVVGALRFLIHQAVPLVFAVIVIVFGLWASNNLGFAILGATGTVCRAATPATELAAGERRDIRINIRAPCAITGIKLQAGAKYRLDIQPGTPWQDDGITNISHQGYSSLAAGVPRYVLFGVPLRRMESLNWFAPLAQIGRFGHDVRALGTHSTLIESKTSADLYVYVNDAVIGLPFIWDHFYDNNQGELEFVVYQTEPPPSY